VNPGDIVANGQLVAAIPIALLAGLISFASPCVLPLVPGYLAYVGGMSTAAKPGARTGSGTGGSSSSARPARLQPGKPRLLLGVAGFIAGFTLVFVLTGAFVGTVGAFFVQWQDLITRILGAVVIVMGFVFVGQVSFMQRTIKPSFRPATGLAGAPLLGIVFAIGWTPCLGPVLTAITGLSLNSGSTGRGALLGLFYCIGLGIPFVLVALGLSWMTGTIAFLKRHIRAINIAGGVLLMIIGILMVSGIWGKLMSQLGMVIQGFVTPL
jgi:cytochrome c-type biogenesis protein